MVRTAAQRVCIGMSEPKDDTVRSIIEQAREEILSDPEETDGKARQEAAE